MAEGLLTEAALPLYEQALAIARTIGDHYSEGNQLGNLGIAYASLGQVQEATAYHEQALTIARAIGDRQGEASHCWNLGLLYEETDPAHAAALMQVSVDFEREIGHPDAEADAAWVRTLPVTCAFFKACYSLTTRRKRL